MSNERTDEKGEGIWPAPDWEACDPEAAGMSTDHCDRYLSWLGSRAQGAPFGTVIVRFGKVVCEGYGSGGDASSKWEIGSIRKSVASALLGMAIEEGELSLDTAVYDVWPEIFTLTGEEKDKQVRMFHLATHTSGWMTERGPGHVWLYNNAACTAGNAVLGRVYGLPEDRIAPLVAERIAGPIGAGGWDCYHYEETFCPGNHGRPGPKLAIASTLRDLARYGYLWLREGEWNGVQVAPGEYVRQARRNQAGNLDGHYGYWWFTNDGRVLLPGAPEDAFYHIGNGREERRTVCLVVPGLDLVAVVGTSACTHDLTADYKARPVTMVDGWIRTVLKAILEGP